MSMSYSTGTSSTARRARQEHRAAQQASRCHKLTSTTPLPAQTTALAITENKQQIISTICEQLQEKGRHAIHQQNIVSLLIDPRQYQLKYLRGLS